MNIEEQVWDYYYELF